MGTPSRMAAPMHGDSVKPPRNPMMQMVQGFADGGLIGGAVDAIKNRQNTLAAIDASSAPAPAPQAAPAKPSMGSEADNYAAQAASIEAEQQAAAKTRMAAAKPKSLLSKLGFSEGGKIKGKGTPTSDSISAEVADTGEQIKVSTDERIVSAAQDAFLEKLAADLGFPNLNALLEQGTGQPVGPTMRDGTPAAAYGASDDDLKNIAANPLDRILSGAATSMPKGTGGMSSMDYSPTPAKPMAQPMQVAASASNPLAQETRDYSLPEGTPVPFTPRVEVATPQQKPVFQGGDASMKAADPKGYSAVASQQPGAQERTFSNVSGSAESNPAPAVGTSSLPNLLNSFVPSVAETQPDPAAGRGFVNPLDAAAQKQNDFTEVGKATSAIGGPLDAHGNSLAATNEMKNKLAELTSTAPANVMVLGDSGRVESQALMDKWGRESAAKAAMDAAIANPKSAQAVASVYGSGVSGDSSRNRDAVDLATRSAADATNRRGQDTRLQEVGMTTDVAARGQDITARTQAAQLAGNPLDNALKQTSVDLNKSALSKVQQQDKMVADIGAEQDPEKRRALMDTLLASQGKNPSEHRYLKVEGGEEIASDGFTKVKRPSGVYDTISGKFLPMDGAAPAQQVPAADKRVVGQTYTTPKGPMIWRGNGWEAVNK